MTVKFLFSSFLDVRKDFIHKLTTKLASENQAIVIEDLYVSGMMANRKLAKAISDCGFYEFRRQLEYKTKLFGSELKIADRWFASSKTCCCCGHKKESLSLSERVFNCETCNLEIDRDLLLFTSQFLFAQAEVPCEFVNVALSLILS